MIHVGYFATIRELTGKKEENITRVPAPETVLALMSDLSVVYGKKFRDFCLDGGDEKVSRNVNILVNGRHIHHIQEGETPLKDGDDVSIFPLIGGG